MKTKDHLGNSYHVIKYYTVNGTESFQCPICEAKCIFNDFKTHLLQHNMRRPFTCDVCKKRVRDSHKLHAHLFAHIKDKPRPFQCLLCASALMMRRSVIQHLRDIHAVKLYQCLACKTKFSHYNLLKKHLTKSGHYSNNKESKDDLLDSQSDCLSVREYDESELNLQKVIERNNADVEKCVATDSYTVSNPQDSYKRNDLLNENENVQSNHYGGGDFYQKFYYIDNSETFPCLLCDVRCSYSAFYTHLMSHDFTEPFSCFLCKKEFNLKANLFTHLYSHIKEKPFPFRCAICEHAYKGKKYMLKHLRKGHRIKPFTCAVCNMKFSQFSFLKEHITNNIYGKDCRESNTNQLDSQSASFSTGEGEELHTENLSSSEVIEPENHTIQTKFLSREEISNNNADDDMQIIYESVKNTDYSPVLASPLRRRSSQESSPSSEPLASNYNNSLSELFQEEKEEEEEKGLYLSCFPVTQVRLNHRWILEGNDEQYLRALQHEKSVVDQWMQMSIM